jgi:hypothetical protein
MLPPETRLPEGRGLVEKYAYFVVHAPRQTGKTTSLRALGRRLTAAGQFAALHFSCEAAGVAGEDVALAQQTILDEIRLRARTELPPELQPPDPWPEGNELSMLRTALAGWANACPRRLALFFDEIDALPGRSLVGVLRQLRAGFADRPGAFPASVVLCGLRDVRDYKAASGGDLGRLGTSSPFNIKVASLRIGDFDEDDLRALYRQHTEATGQEFTDEALSRAWDYTQGQPWLTNALAREVLEEMQVEAPTPIEDHHIDEAKERLILARQTHLDSLVARLKLPEVRRIVEPLIAGEGNGDLVDEFDDDLTFVRDLGLVSQQPPLRIANPIYREVIVRLLSTAAEVRVTDEPRSFVLPDGTLDFERVLRDFAAWWREHGEFLAGAMPYPEVAPQLVLMAYLQRVVNGGGYIDREYGVGRGRIDLLVRWPYRGERGQRVVQREALELKVWREGRPDPLGKGLEQLDGYLARLGLDQGVLVVFDRRDGVGSPEERTRFDEAETATGRSVVLLRA